MHASGGPAAGKLPSTEAYIYYRIDRASEPAWRERMLALQRTLRERHAGLRTGLLRRAEADNAQVTLMETYALDTGDAAASTLDPVLADLEAGCAALPGRPAAARHCEVFERCA